MRARAFVLIACVGWALAIAALVARPAWARPSDDARPRERAEELFRTAEEADLAFDFPRALALYDEARATDPGSPRSPRAEARSAVLRRHAEGAFAPFARLERARRDPAFAEDVRAIDALVADAESFPPGETRVDVWVLAAEAYAARFGREADAARLLERVVADERADPVLAQKAARDLVSLHVARGDLAAAERTVRAAGRNADAKLAGDVRRLVRRRRLHAGAIAVLVALVLLAARAVFGAAGRGRARGATLGAVKKTIPVALAYAAYVAVSGALLATGYERGTSAPFLAFGVVLVPIVLIARAWGATANGGRPARLARGALCGAGVLGAAFLVLEAIDVGFLEGMGL